MVNENRQNNRKSDHPLEKIKTYLFVIVFFMTIMGILGGAIIKAYILPESKKIAEEVVREQAFPSIDGQLMQRDIDYIKIRVDEILNKINKNGK